MPPLRQTGTLPSKPGADSSRAGCAKILLVVILSFRVLAGFHVSVERGRDGELELASRDLKRRLRWEA